jgi:hypothetical protein
MVVSGEMLLDGTGSAASGVEVLPASLSDALRMTSSDASGMKKGMAKR